MKVFLKSVLVIFLFIPLFSASASAHSSSAKHTSLTVVRGNIYNASQFYSGIGGLSVSVTCYSGNTKINNQIATTDGNGLYVVNYNHHECDNYDKVTSIVTFNNQTKSQTVWVSSDGRATLDFYFGSVGVAEFPNNTSVVLVILAAMGMYFYFQRRLQPAN